MDVCLVDKTNGMGIHPKKIEKNLEARSQKPEV
jgi:hypothetical protein